jgi:hypothetical protein
MSVSGAALRTTWTGLWLKETSLQKGQTSLFRDETYEQVGFAVFMPANFEAVFGHEG